MKQEPLTLDSKQARSSSFTGYFQQAMNRTNLDVLTYATVTNILTAGNSTSLKALGVVATSQSTGEVLVIVANEEVILSAGTFQTPQLLMVSVSDASQCREFPLIFVLRESDRLMNFKEMVSQLWLTIPTWESSKKKHTHYLVD